VLSGFLIGNILLKTFFQTHYYLNDIKHFWIRRWFRTLPLYYLILLILFCLQYFLTGNAGNFNWKFLFFGQNLTRTHPIAFQEAWSLSVEEWFYLLLPILVYSFHRVIPKKNTTIILTILVLICLPLIGRLTLDYWGYNRLRDVVPFRFDSLGMGVAGAYIARRWPDLFFRMRYKLLIIAILLTILNTYLLLNATWKINQNPFYYFMEAFSILCFFPYFSNLRKTKFSWFNNIVVFISVISYSLYLTHSTAIRGYLLPWINNLLKLNPTDLSINWKLNLFLYWSLSLLIATLLYKYYEKPMTSLRDRFSPHKKRESV
jgi:peptidoglycan/LPS O-acetylase OafA/YrhL